jgi:hypothetical protein
MKQIKGGIVSLDPGIRTFMSLFSDKGYCEVGNVGPQIKKKKPTWRIPRKKLLPNDQKPPSTPSSQSLPPKPPSSKHSNRKRNRPKKFKQCPSPPRGPLAVNECRMRTLRSELSRSEELKLTRRQRYRRRKLVRRLENRNIRIVDDVHRRLISYLTQNFQVVLIPNFRVKSITKRGKRKLGSKTVAKLMRWSHYKYEILLRY